MKKRSKRTASAAPGRTMSLGRWARMMETLISKRDALDERIVMHEVNLIAAVRELELTRKEAEADG